MCIFWLFILLGSVSNVFGENGVDDEVYGKTAENSRQKRLLFYDEEGNLVKMFINPYLRDTPFSSDKVIGTFLNPFFSLFRPPPFAFPAHYVIPVSSEVIHQISTDPVFQNKLMILPPQPLDMKADPLCNNRRNQVPSPQICNNFLNCWDGWAFEQECPAGLLFSNLGYCDYPHNVNCFDRRVIVSDATQSQPQPSQLQPQQPKPQPQPQPQPQLPPLSQPEPQLPPLSQPQPQFPAQFQPQAQCSQEFEVFRNKVDCREFFVCVNQLPVKFKCPADLAYNQEFGICDYPERVDCNGSFNPSTSAPTPEASSLTSEKDAEASGPTETLVPAGSKPPIGVQTTLTKSIYNSESWSTSHVAMSRQDAIRQLELRRFANVHSSF